MKTRNRWYAIAGASVFIAGCASIDPALLTEGNNKAQYQGERQELVKAGEALWSDASIGNSGLSCQSCHMNDAQFKKTFNEPYPHQVKMASNMAGLDEITTEQMVQLCMMVPMKAEPLAWDSRELAALSAYIDDVVQPRFAQGQNR